MVLCIKLSLLHFLSSTSEKAQEEPPAKLLDDLFRKTKAAPCIYWLPLTDSQVSAGLPVLLRASARLGRGQGRESRDARVRRVREGLRGSKGGN